MARVSGECLSLCLSSLRTPSQQACIVNRARCQNSKGQLAQCFLHLWITEFRIQRSQHYEKKILNRNKSRRIQIQIPSPSIHCPAKTLTKIQNVLGSSPKFGKFNWQQRLSPLQSWGPIHENSWSRGTQSSDWATIKSLIGFGRQILTSPHTFLLACDPERGTDIWRMPRALDSFPQHHTECLLISIMARCSSMW